MPRVQKLIDCEFDMWSALTPHFEPLAARLVGLDVTLAYRRGWPAEADLEKRCSDSMARDLRLRTTHVGPHRADLSFLIDGIARRDRVSRGQQKMLAARFDPVAAAVSQPTSRRVPTSCLLDDPAAELDVDNLGKLLLAIAEISMPVDRHFSSRARV